MISEMTRPPTGTESKETACAEFVSNEIKPIESIMNTLWLEILIEFIGLIL
jgi:hypothetical protein